MKDEAIRATRNWVETIIIGLNLCPFAKADWVRSRVRISVSEATELEKIAEQILTELSILNADNQIETTLLVLPTWQVGFDVFNQTQDFLDALIDEFGWRGVFQLVGFHPDYQFAETDRQDVENYTNRAPYVTLHILREQSVEKVVKRHPNTELIPNQNIRKLNEIGHQEMRRRLEACYE